MDILFSLLLVLSVLSHIGMSLFFGKPRFNRLITVVIWLVYAVVFLLLPPETSKLNYTLMLLLNGVLFFLSTKGKLVEKGFLFISYACVYSAFGVFVTFVSEQALPIVVKIIFIIMIMAFLQVLLYMIIFPRFRKISPYIDRGWGKYYAIVIAFLVITAAQAIYMDGVTRMDNGRFQIFLLTTAVFYVTYAAVFASLRDMVDLAKERRKQIHTELLMTQVQAQATEVALARKSRHDLRHHNEILYAFAKSDNIKSILEYLEKQDVELKNQRTIRFCENETVNNILWVYLTKAEKEGVKFIANAAVKTDTVISAPDLVTVLANVVENALHGAMAAKSSEPVIKVDIYYKAKKLVIVCENSCDLSLDFTDDMPEERRGIGIRSICDTAEKYGGSTRFTASNGVFRCTIAMSS